MAAPFIDFQAIKDRVTFEQGIQLLKLEHLEGSGEQRRYKCPVCNDRTLCLNLKKTSFKCHTSKKAGTDVIALVAYVKGIRQREAAVLLDETFPDRTPKAQNYPSPAKVEPEGRAVPDTAQMLGIGPAAIKALGAGYDEATQRFSIPLRSAAGVQFGTLGIATDADQRPLLAFVFDEEETKKANIGPDGLRQLFRVV